MSGIVSLLDDKHYQLVGRLWAELEEKVGLRGIYVTPFPHFSYHIAQSYDRQRLEPILQCIAQSTRQFTIKTAGLGIFTSKAPVLYIAIVRSQELTRFHRIVWHEISGISSGAVAYYDPENWMPHITMGYGDVHKDNLPDLIRGLSEHDFNWEITVNNLSFIEDTGKEQKLRFRFGFGV